jgi:hypothetical protein
VAEIFLPFLKQIQFCLLPEPQAHRGIKKAVTPVEEINPNKGFSTERIFNGW